MTQAYRTRQELHRVRLHPHWQGMHFVDSAPHPNTPATDDDLPIGRALIIVCTIAAVSYIGWLAWLAVTL